MGLIGNLIKALIGREDICYHPTELMPCPTDQFTRLGQAGTVNMTNFPDVYKTHIPIINARYYNNGVLNEATINLALAGIGSNKRILYIEPGAWSIGDNVTSAVNVTLWIDPGATLTIASGKTFTINGGIIANPSQVFTGSGSVVINSSQITYDDAWQGGTLIARFKNMHGQLRGSGLIWRFYDTVSSSEWGIQCTGGNLVILQNTGTESSPTWKARYTFTSGGGLISQPAGNYGIQVSDGGSTIVSDATTSGNTLTLPLASVAGSSWNVAIKKKDSTANTVTIAVSGSDKIDNASSYILAMPYEGVTLITDGTSWYAIRDHLSVSSFIKTLLTAADAPTAQATLLISGKNAIINPDMTISQRGTSFAVTGGSQYTIDRWELGVAVSTGACTITRDTDVPTTTQAGRNVAASLKVDVTTTDTVGATKAIGLIQNVEGYNFNRFVGQSGTLSFWVKSNMTGTFCVSFRNSVYDRSYLAEYTINQANTWQKVSVTIPFNYSGGTWNYTTGIGIMISWTLMAGSNYQTTAGAWQNGNYFSTANMTNNLYSTLHNYFWLTGVQFETGSTATAFEPRLIDQEMAMCARYYQRLTCHVRGWCYGSTYGVGCTINYPVVMRATPTSTLISAGTNTNLYAGNPVFDNTTADSACFRIQGAAQGDMYAYGYTYEFAAEL